MVMDQGWGAHANTPSILVGLAFALLQHVGNPALLLQQYAFPPYIRPNFLLHHLLDRVQLAWSSTEIAHDEVREIRHRLLCAPLLHL